MEIRKQRRTSTLALQTRSRAQLVGMLRAAPLIPPLLPKMPLRVCVCVCARARAQVRVYMRVRSSV